MKKSRKITSLLLTAAMAVGLLAGCSGNSSSAGSSGISSKASSEASSVSVSSEPVEKTAVNIAVLKGPTAFGAVKLMEDNEAGTTKNSYNFSMSTSPEEIVSKITTGEVDIAAAPANLAATLYQKTKGKIKLAAVNTLGVLYILEKGDSIQSVADLKGKTIYATGQGATPEYSLDYILLQNEIDPESDVTIEWKSEHSELATLVAAGEADIALLPEPFVTQVLSKNADIRIALDLTKEWKSAGTGSELITGAMIAGSAFVDENKDAFDSFLEEYKASVDYVNANVADSAALIEKFGIISAAVAEKAIPNCNIVYIDGADMKTYAADYFSVLFNADPKSVGGALPDDNLYYQK